MILEGVTDQGAVVPVQVTAQGKLVAEGLAGPAGPAGPEGPQGPAGQDGEWSRVGNDINYTAGRVLVGKSSASTSHLLQVEGPTLTSWFACDTKTVANVLASTASVLTIRGSGSVMVKVYIQVVFAANAGLNAFFDYDILTADTGGFGGGAVIRETLNESVGSFQVATGDFVVTRSASAVIITYTNQASGTNKIIWRVAGVFESLSIA